MLQKNKSEWRPRLPKRLMDVPEIRVVDNNIEFAIRKLKNRVAALGTMRNLKLRKLNPSTADRKRAKEKIAESRRRKQEINKRKRKKRQ